jgi:hypothetical protein
LCVLPLSLFFELQGQVFADETQGSIAFIACAHADLSKSGCGEIFAKLVADVGVASVLLLHLHVGGQSCGQRLGGGRQQKSAKIRAAHPNGPAGPEHAGEFAQGPDRVGQMFQESMGKDAIEGRIREGQ